MAAPTVIIRGHPAPLARGVSGAGSRPFQALTILLGLLLLSGCNTTRKVVADAGTAAYPEASTLGKVLVLAPQLTVERMEDGTPTQLPNKAEFVRTDLARLALESLTSHGIAAASADAAGGAMAMGQAAEVETAAASHLLMKEPKPEHLTAALRRLGENTGSSAVLIQHVRVRLGPGGSWDPNTGMITSAMNTTRMTAAILATTNGQVLWRNQVHLREVPRVQDSSYRDAVGRLFPKASPHLSK
jgi:hypothetical protein